jgi:hypothetical protein
VEYPKKVLGNGRLLDWQSLQMQDLPQTFIDSGNKKRTKNVLVIGNVCMSNRVTVIVSYMRVCEKLSLLILILSTLLKLEKVDMRNEMIHKSRNFKKH